jgi:5'-deoxynucleotidase YfbR-like HD superfamily hydrolase
VNKYEKILRELVYLQERYSGTYRETIQPYKFKISKETELKSEKLRESLLEHVGHLPIIATTIHPYLKDSSIDLGKALIMLAIHDIGELILGDTMTFLKDDYDPEEEYKYAIKLLHSNYHNYYSDIENQTSTTGKFAKSIDKLAPDIWEFSLKPEIAIKKYQETLNIEKKEDIIKIKRDNKLKYMEWNPFLKEFYQYILEQLDKHFS